MLLKISCSAIRLSSNSKQLFCSRAATSSLLRLGQSSDAGKALLLRLGPSSSSSLAPSTLFHFRHFSTAKNPAADATAQEAEAEADAKSPKERATLRRAYVAGGCLMFIWLSTHAILLYNRRSEYRLLNEKLPPVSWDEFVEDYVVKGSVKSIVFQPQFDVANVYLHNHEETVLKQKVASIFPAPPDKFSRPPDVRVNFEGKLDALLKALAKAMEKRRSGGEKQMEEKEAAIEVTTDEFPSKRELSFIMMSTIFALGAVVLVK